MRLQVLPILAIVIFSCVSFAADKRPSPSSSSKASQPSPAVILADADSLGKRIHVNRAMPVWDRKANWRLPLNAARDVCYTMRTYKLRATERLSENENGSRGYSTCLFARDYQLRSADVPDDNRSQSGSRPK